MYLSDLIRNCVNDKLNETLLGKKVSFFPIDGEKTTIFCKKVEFWDDDGNCGLIFTDTEDNTYDVDGQGIDIWFKIVD